MSPGGSSGSQPLADLIVKFSLQGQAALAQAVDELKGKLDKLTTAVGQFHFDSINKIEQVKQKTTEAQKPAVELGKTFKEIGRTINVALALGQASILGFVRQGLAMSTTGLMLQQRMERLALAISGLFRPEVLKITEMVERLTSWLNHLSDTQREAIARWVQAGAAALSVSLILPRVIAAITGAAAAVKGLAVAVGLLEGSTGIGALLPILGFTAQGLVALAVGTESGREGLSRLWEAAKPLVRSLEKLGEALQVGKFVEDMGKAFVGLVVVLDRVAQSLTVIAEKLHDIIQQADRLSESRLVKMAELFRGEGAKAGIFGPLPWALQHLMEMGEGGLPHVKNRTTDVPRTSGFENVENVYNRIAQLTVGQRDPQERTATATEAIQRVVEQAVLEALNQRQPVAVGH